MEEKKCPVCSGVMSIESADGKTTLRGVGIEYPREVFRCQNCGVTIGNQGQTERVQRAISDAYRNKVGLLTADEIKAQRDRLGLSQQQLADKIGVGVASIKRWETGAIQTQVMDKALRMLFTDSPLLCDGDITGNRNISLNRIKLVIEEIGQARHRPIRLNDQMLYSAKSVWYADMASYRAMGRGMTGASYAVLPQGPQLNNYKELIKLIKQANSQEAAPLSLAEADVIKMVARKFPTDKSAYHAAHNEPLWLEIESQIGSLIPYTLAHRLTAI